VTSLVERVNAVAESLDAAGLAWALGGALALAYATAEPRGTRDIDVNVFVPAGEAAQVFAALPDGVRSGAADLRAAVAEDQVRLWWDDTPVDIFFAANPFDYEAARRCRRVPFAGREISVLAPEDLAVFKAMFDRPKDWVDIEEMAAQGALDRAVAAERLAGVLGTDDTRVGRLAGLATN
jgi:hypothetical protein